LKLLQKASLEERGSLLREICIIDEQKSILQVKSRSSIHIV